MKPTKALTKGQYKKVRRRERLAAMTPAERKAHDRQRAENKALTKAEKASPLAFSQSKYDSLAAHDDDATREMNAAAIRGHNLNNAKVKHAIQLTGEANRKTLAYPQNVIIKELPDPLTQPEEKKPEPYRFQPRKVSAGTDGNFDRCWNEAVKQKLNPYEYINDIVAQRKAAKLAEHTEKLAAEYIPEIKPVTMDSASKQKVAKKGVIGRSGDEWENK